MKLIVALCLPLSLLGSIASANPITVQITETHFSTSLSTHTPISDQSSEATSVVPLDEYLLGNVSGLTFAAATADLFTVMTATSGLYDFHIAEEAGLSQAMAYAESVVRFVPLLSETSTLTFDLIGSAQYFFSDGLIRLVDLTSQTVAFEYFWGYSFGRTLVDLPSQPTESLVIGTHSVGEHTWLAGHEYQLIMQVDTDASTDSQGMVMRMNGLVATPEPAALWIAIIGFAALLIRCRVKAETRIG